MNSFRITVLALMLTSSYAQAQPNCNYYLWTGDTAQYEACILVEENIEGHYQFSKWFHVLMDSALQVCPRFAYAYREKAAPYVKSGNFIEWKKNMDLAVKYDQDIYLPIRASVRHKFFADHRGAIDDINLYIATHSGDLASAHNGTYHIKMVKALCYKGLGMPDTAIAIIEELFSSEGYDAYSFDHLHLGVLYLEINKPEQALKNFQLQAEQYNLAENEYYTALALIKSDLYEEVMEHLAKARALLVPGTKMHDGYNEMADQIYVADIEKAEQLLQQ